MSQQTTQNMVYSNSIYSLKTQIPIEWSLLPKIVLAANVYAANSQSLCLRRNFHKHIFQFETKITMSHQSNMKSLLGRTRAGPYADTKTTHSEAIWQMGQTVREDSEQNWEQQVFRPWWPHPGPAGNNKNLIFPIPCPLLLPLLTASLKPWIQDLNLWICPSSTSFLLPLSCACLWHIVLYWSLLPTDREGVPTTFSSRQ